MEDKLDKDFMSLTRHILQSRQKSIRIWNVFYPLKASYLKTLSHALEPFLFNPQPESTIEMINNIRVKDATEAFITKKRLDLDIDRELSNALLTQVMPHCSLAVYDNYKYNQTFTSVMNSFLIDVIKRVHIAMQKHPSIEFSLSFDGSASFFPLSDLLKSIIKEEEFDLLKFARENLNLSILLQSHILIIVALLFLDSSNLI